MDTALSVVFYLITLTALSVFIIKNTKTYWIDPELEDRKLTQKGEK